MADVHDVTKSLKQEVDAHSECRVYMIPHGSGHLKHCTLARSANALVRCAEKQGAFAAPSARPRPTVEGHHDGAPLTFKFHFGLTEEWLPLLQADPTKDRLRVWETCRETFVDTRAFVLARHTYWLRRRAKATSDGSGVTWSLTVKFKAAQFRREEIVQPVPSKIIEYTRRFHPRLFARLKKEGIVPTLPYTQAAKHTRHSTTPPLFHQRASSDAITRAEYDAFVAEYMDSPGLVKQELRTTLLRHDHFSRRQLCVTVLVDRPPSEMIKLHPLLDNAPFALMASSGQDFKHQAVGAGDMDLTRAVLTTRRG